MATEQQVNSLRAAAAAVRKIPIEQLVSNPNWGNLSFDSARAPLELSYSLAGHIEQLPVELLPGGTADSFKNAFDAVLAQISRMRDFDIASVSGTPSQHRDEIVANLKAASEALLVATQAWIPFLAYQKGDVQRNIQNLSSAVEQAGALIDGAKKTAADGKTEVDGIVSAARDAAASVGVAHFTVDFSDKATALASEATKWLNATAGLAAASIAVAIGFYFVPVPATATAAQLAQLLTSKLVILAVLLTATVWCGRLYRATKHQVAMNSHRANALKTFQAFVKATADEPTKNAVLLEATRSIFSVGSTGYLDGGDSGAESGSKVLEVIKNATSSGGR